MGLLGDGDDDGHDADRVQRMVDGATHDSITEEVLTSLKGGGLVGGRFLYDKPLIEYLEEGEQPHIFLSADRAVPEFSGGEVVEFDKNGGKTMHLLTDDRWVIVVPHSEEGDQSHSIRYSNLERVDYKTARTRHEFYLYTDNTKITIAVSGTFDEDDDIRATVEFLRTQFDASDSEDTEISEEEIQRAEKIVAESAEFSTFEKDDLIDTGATHTPIIKHLDKGEQIQYILEDPEERRGIGLAKKNLRDKPEGGKSTTYVVTDERILIIVPKGQSDKLYSLGYSDLEVIDYKMAKMGRRNRLVLLGPDVREEHEKDEVFDADSDHMKQYLRNIGMMEKEGMLTYHLWLSQGEQENSAQRVAIQYIYHQATKNCEMVLFTPAQTAKLKILDRETGEAKMKTKGWEYGLGFIERNRSKSVIEKEGYEADIHGLAITSDGINITAGDPDGQGSERQHIVRPFDEIGAIDEHENGFTFFSTTGIYRIEQPITRIHPIPDEEIESAVEFIRENIGDNSVDDTSPEPESDDGLDQLEKLADLKDKGVISEEEFEEKKSEILDSI